MTLTYVTAFHPLRSEPYWSHFELLVQSGVSILLFLDERCSEPPPAPNLRVVRVPLVHAWDITSVHLPPHRSPEKDTAEFLSLMALKLRYMTDALAYTDTSHLAWVDFRVFHVIRDIPRVQEKLRVLATHPFPQRMKILAPGCWDPCPERDPFISICWRFCGGFLLGPREAFPLAYARQTELIRAGLPRVTWEVNYWAQMDDVFTWYSADHDDRLLLHVPELPGEDPVDPPPPRGDGSTSQSSQGLPLHDDSL